MKAYSIIKYLHGTQDSFIETDRFSFLKKNKKKKSGSGKE